MNTSQSLASDLVPVYIKEKLLSIAEKNLVFYDLADKENLPEGNGKTIQFSRYERLPLPITPLVEGVTPGGSDLTVSTVQAVVDQWGDFVPITDVAELTVKHPALRIAIDRLATQHDETLDRETQVVLMGGNNVTFAGAATSRDTLVPGDVMTTDLIRLVVATLRQQGAMTYDGRNFMGVVDPFVEMDLSKDSTFVTAASYQNLVALMNAEIGKWMGVRWKTSNLIPIISLIALTTIYTATATDVGAPVGGEVNFTATSSVLVQVTQLDPQTHFETGVSAVQTVTNGASFSVTVTIASGAPSGVYKIYVSLVNGAVATLQQVDVHTTGTTDTFVFIMAGTPSAANRFVVTASGAVAPPAPPSGANVHISYVFGKESFGVCDLGGLRTTLTPNVPSDSDPLVQRRKAGWKQIWKAVIKNTQFFERIESLSAFN